MSEEATLDAFVPDDEDAADVEADDTVGGSQSTASDSHDTTPESQTTAGSGPGAGGEAVERAAVTSSWLDDDGTCSACGEPAGRLWTVRDARVCTACKPWTRSGEDACDQ